MDLASRWLVPVSSGRAGVVACFAGEPSPFNGISRLPVSERPCARRAPREKGTDGHIAAPWHAANSNDQIAAGTTAAMRLETAPLTFTSVCMFQGESPRLYWECNGDTGWDEGKARCEFVRQPQGTWRAQ
jgi:hypothetical protein